MKKTIYINGRFLTQSTTGTQRYAYELLNNFDHLLEIDPWRDKVKIYCLVPPKTNLEAGWTNITVKAIGINRGNLWEQIDLPLYLKGKFLFSPAGTGPGLYRNQAATMHDASVFAVPQAYSFGFRLKHKFILKNLSRLAQVIFTDSEFSQKELSRYLNQPRERYQVIHLAGDHINRIKPDLEILKKHGLKKNQYILTVASHSPHKNLRMAENAVKLIKSNIKIVFAGGYFQTVFNRAPSQQATESTALLGYINDSELKALYENALGYLFPSYYEGFGLPILEAMHCGCPVLCARAASLPEVAGKAALFFEPMNANEISNRIDQLYSNRKLRNEMIQKGYRRTHEFTWEITARATLNALLGAIRKNT